MRAGLPVLLGAGFAAGAVSVLADRQDRSPGASVIAEGCAIYEVQCAACHGAGLEGQPDWRSPLPSARLPAPPHDASGHTWHHPDNILFRIVRDGTAAVVGNGYESDMPASAMF